MKFPTNILRRQLLWNTFLLLLIIARIATVRAVPETTIRVEPYASTAQVGESFIINITLTDAQNLYGVEVALHWNASILQIVNVDVRLGNESHPDGILYEPIFIAKNETVQNEDRYLLAATSMAPADSFNGSGNIVKITFDVTSVGSCKLDLETELRGKPSPGDVAPLIEHITADGFFGRQIGISAFPMTVTIGEEVDVSGSTIPPQPNVDVTIFHRSEIEVNWRILATVRTDAQGAYQYKWRPEEGGKHEIRAIAVIEDKEETSQSAYVTVKTPEQPTWVNTTTIAIAVIVVVIITSIMIYRKKIRKFKTHKK